MLPHAGLWNVPGLPVHYLQPQPLCFMMSPAPTMMMTLSLTTLLQDHSLAFDMSCHMCQFSVRVIGVWYGLVWPVWLMKHQVTELQLFLNLCSGMAEGFWMGTDSNFELLTNLEPGTWPLEQSKSKQSKSIIHSIPDWPRLDKVVVSTIPYHTDQTIPHISRRKTCGSIDGRRWIGWFCGATQWGQLSVSMSSKWPTDCLMQCRWLTSDESDVIYDNYNCYLLLTYYYLY